MRRQCLLVSETSGTIGSVQRIILDIACSVNHETVDWEAHVANVSSRPLERNTDFLRLADHLGVRVKQFANVHKFSMRAVKEMAFYLRNAQINIVNANGYKSDVHSFIACKLSRVSFVSTLHTWTEHDWKDRLYSRVDQWILRYADLCIAVSDGMKRIAVSKGIPADKIVVVHNWVNVSEIEEKVSKSSVTRSELGLQESDRVFLVPARLSPEKGHRYLVDAIHGLVPRYPQIRLAFAGEGYYRSHLEEYVRQKGLEQHVLFLGYRRDIHRIMLLSDWVVLPSFKEGLPLALLEAMALKKPIIATNVSGVPEIVQHEVNGFLVPAGDVDALSTAVEKAVRDGDIGAAYGLKGYEIVIARFNPEVQIPKIVRIYQDVVSGKRTSP